MEYGIYHGIITCQLPQPSFSHRRTGGLGWHVWEVSPAAAFSPLTRPLLPHTHSRPTIKKF